MKRFVSFVTAVVMVLAVSVLSFGAKVNAIEDGVFVTSIDYKSGSNFEIGGTMGDIYESFKPGDVINIYLNPTKFTGGDFTPATGMSAADLERAGVTYRVSGGENSNLIKNIVFKEKMLNNKRVAVLQVQLVDKLVSTEDKEFSTTLTLYADKVKQQSIQIGGKLTAAGGVLPIARGEDTVYLGDGTVGQAEDNITSVKIDAGEGVILTARLQKGQKYYAVAGTNPTDKDIDFMNENPSIEHVYQLDTNGFDNNTTVRIKTSDSYFVYGSDGTVLGKTGEELALSRKYYLSNAEVELSPEDGGIDEPALPNDDDEEDWDTVPDTDFGDGSDEPIPDTGMPSSAPPIIAFSLMVVAAGVAVVALRKKD